jgi:signal transduction histidine kinase
MHRIVGVLRGDGGAADEDDLRRVSLAKIDQLAERARAAGLDVRLTKVGEPGALTQADELTAYRLVQEGLTNALKHAGSGAVVAVTLTFTGEAVAVDIVDDGVGRLAGSDDSGGSAAGAGSGSRSGAAFTSGGNGLVGMRERVALHGGTFSAGPRLGPGWAGEGAGAGWAGHPGQRTTR